MARAKSGAETTRVVIESSVNLAFVEFRSKPSKLRDFEVWARLVQEQDKIAA